ncbi:MAG TPA: hypothetical protein VNE63_00810 [Candidatus Acidoferrales bacterium]|nr:hypothetical protein [Candidatus Acidoferrales bacterium]
MQPRDVHECAKVVAAHPVVGPRYGRAIRHLGPSWLRLLGSEALCAIVLEEVEGGRITICGFGVSVVVDDAFLHELKASPFWFGPELAKRVMQGRSPVLSDRKLREANSKEGLNLLVWEGAPLPGFDQRNDVFQKLVNTFIELHRGLFWKEAITAQYDTVPGLQWAVAAGGLFWDPAQGRYWESAFEPLEEIVRKPHVVGLTRETELSRTGSWVGALFNYQPPRVGFSSGEQMLLLAALGGLTDQELAAALGISLPAVKKTWLSAYRRTSQCLPDLIPNHLPQEEWMVRRGKEKRRRLLSYLREHPEELRLGSRRSGSGSSARKSTRA